MKSICVFCGSSFGNRPVYTESARRLGQMLERLRTFKMPMIQKQFDIQAS